MFFSKKRNNVVKENIWRTVHIYFSRRVLKEIVRCFQKQHFCPEGRGWERGSFEPPTSTRRDPQTCHFGRGQQQSFPNSHRKNLLGVTAADTDPRVLLQRWEIRISRGVDWESDFEQMPWKILVLRQVCFQSQIYLSLNPCSLSLVIWGKLLA